MNSRWMKWAAAAGAATCGAAAALSFADAVGYTPAPFFLRNRFWFTSLRVGGVPVEFVGTIWFLCALAVSVAHARQARTAAVGICLSGAAITGFAIWYVITRSSMCWPVYGVIATSGIILLVTAFDADAWPASFWSAVREDAGAFAGSPSARAGAIGFGALVLFATSVMYVQASRVSREEAFERDLRRWYLHQDQSRTPPALLPGRPGGVLVVEFTDYFSDAARNVAPQRAAQLADFEQRGLPVDLAVRHLPSEPDCNPRHTEPVHAGACDAAIAVKLAFDLAGRHAAVALSTWFYRRAPALSPQLIHDRLEELGWLDDFERRRGELRRAVIADVELAQSLGIVTVPAYFINGVRMPEGRGMLSRLLRIESERRLSPASAVGAMPRSAALAAGPGGITGSPPAVPDISIASAPSIGNASALFALVEFADFQCNFCAAFSRETLPELKRKYIDTGRLRFVYLHMPLPPIHAQSLPAAEAAECAHRQGRFWPLHDLLFAHQDRLDAGSLRTFALETGVEPSGFDRCVAGEARAAVAEHMAISAELGVHGTPAFLLGSVEDGRLRVLQRLQGAKPLTAFIAAIDALFIRGAGEGP